MKVAIWIVADRELLYDTITDELIIRDVPITGDPRGGRVDRISIEKVFDAYVKARAPLPINVPVNKVRSTD